MKNFAIIGVGGYIAPRHIEAINSVGANLICAMDTNDSVGILDRYTQDVEFFTNLPELDKFMTSVKGTDKEINFVSICSPNFLHFEHIKFALEHGCDVICEKPLVLKSEQLDELVKIEEQTGKKVNTVLQLRVHDSLLQIQSEIVDGKEYNVDLNYITSRGPWYHKSWKGNTTKSGGLTSNIGVHFFDMLIWLFGDVEDLELHHKDDFVHAGAMKLKNANVRWVLSVDKKYLPKSVQGEKTTYRSITIDGNEIEFSGGFTELHNTIYKNVMDNNGFGVTENFGAISVVEKLREIDPSGIKENSHPYLKEILSE